MQWGLFVVSGLSVGAVYAMSGVGLVLLYRATGVLNFANGALGAIGALLTWQLAEWGWPAPVGWAAAVLIVTHVLPVPCSMDRKKYGSMADRINTSR